MAVTFKVRSGRSLKKHIRFWQPADSDGVQALVDTTGFTAVVQFRGTQRPRRVLLSTHEVKTSPAPAGTVLAQIEPGHWLLTLGRSITRSFPPTVTLEFELVNDANPEDSTQVFEAVILVEPEMVVNV